MYDVKYEKCDMICEMSDIISLKWDVRYEKCDIRCEIWDMGGVIWYVTC